MPVSTTVADAYTEWTPEPFVHNLKMYVALINKGDDESIRLRNDLRGDLLSYMQGNYTELKGDEKVDEHLHPEDPIEDSSKDEERRRWGGRVRRLHKPQLEGHDDEHADQRSADTRSLAVALCLAAANAKSPAVLLTTAHASRSLMTSSRGHSETSAARSVALSGNCSTIRCCASNTIA